jgi:hypothetical protein
MTQETKDRLIYAFGHMVSAQDTDNPHAADSDDEAKRVLMDMWDIDPETVTEDHEALLAIGVMLALAEHFAERYWASVP